MSVASAILQWHLGCQHIAGHSLTHTVWRSVCSCLLLSVLSCFLWIWSSSSQCPMLTHYPLYSLKVPVFFSLLCQFFFTCLHLLWHPNFSVWGLIVLSYLKPARVLYQDILHYCTIVCVMVAQLHLMFTERQLSSNMCGSVHADWETIYAGTSAVLLCHVTAVV